MLRTINSRISQNTEIFQQISDSQAAFISGGMDIPILFNTDISIPDGDTLPFNLSDIPLPEPLSSIIDNSIPVDLSSFITPPSI